MAAETGVETEQQGQRAAPPPAAARSAAGEALGLPAHMIVVGNEKGGSGKSTTAMHIIVALLRLGYAVGSLDLDSRQWTLSRYLSNRAQTRKADNSALPMPLHYFLPKSDKPNREEAEAEEQAKLTEILRRLRAQTDFVVVDCAGSDSYLARIAHSYADTLVTPLNDSFLDLDVLANVDGKSGEIVRPSVYAEMVWEQRKARAARDRGSIDWIVMRNRLSMIDARNKREMGDTIDKLAKRIGFRVAPGFGERVIFRELFLRGLTMLDIFESENDLVGKGGAQLSHIAARQEVRSLLNALNLPNRTPKAKLAAQAKAKAAGA